MSTEKMYNIPIIQSLIVKLCISVCVLSVQSSTCSPLEITYASLHASEDICKEIDAMMYRHRLVKACIMVGVCITTLVNASHWIQRFLQGNVFSIEPSIYKNSAENTLDFLHKGPQACIYAIGYMSAQYVTVRMLTDYAFHPDTLSWYVKRYVPYKNTAALLNEYVTLLKEEELSTQSIDFYVSSIQDLCNTMIHHVQQLTGYMLYAMIQEYEEVQHQYKNSVIFLIDATNSWVDQIKLLSLDNGSDYDAYIVKTNKLVQIITREINHATIISGMSLT